MASPQVEDGFTRIADELLEALCIARLTARELAVAIAVIRKTYGFAKTRDRIAASQLAEITGIARAKIPGILSSLAEKNVVRFHGERRRGRMPTLSIAKDHSKWPKREASCSQPGSNPTKRDAPKLDSRSSQVGSISGKQVAPTLVPSCSQGGSIRSSQGGSIQERRNTLTRERERAAPNRVIFGALVPLLPPDEAERWRAMRPQGIDYPIDRIQAWFLRLQPILAAQGKEPLSAARMLFASVREAEIRDAVLWVESQALMAREYVDDREHDSLDDFMTAFKLN